MVILVNFDLRLIKIPLMRRIIHVCGSKAAPAVASKSPLGDAARNLLLILRVTKVPSSSSWQFDANVAEMWGIVDSVWRLYPSLPIQSIEVGVKSLRLSIQLFLKKQGVDEIEAEHLRNWCSVCLLCVQALLAQTLSIEQLRPSNQTQSCMNSVQAVGAGVCHSIPLFVREFCRDVLHLFARDSASHAYRSPKRRIRIRRCAFLCNITRDEVSTRNEPCVSVQMRRNQKIKVSPRRWGMLRWGRRSWRLSRKKYGIGDSNSAE